MTAMDSEHSPYISDQDIRSPSYSTADIDFFTNSQYDPSDYDAPADSLLFSSRDFMSLINSDDLRGRISPTPFDHGSPSSTTSAGASLSPTHTGVNNTTHRSRASSVSSQHATFDLENMNFGSQSPAWAQQMSPQLPQSPPQLFIPDPESSPVRSPPPQLTHQGGLMPSGPSLHVVPATPVALGNAPASDQTTPYMHQSTLPQETSQTYNTLSQPLPSPYTFPPVEQDQPSPQASPMPPYQQTLNVFQTRSRSKSDTSLRPPVWENLQFSTSDHSLNLTGVDDFNPDAMLSQQQQSHIPPPLNHNVTFGPPLSSVDAYLSPHTNLNNLSVNPHAIAGTELRRVKSESSHSHGHRRGTKSEDIRYLTPGSLKPDTLYPPTSHGDYLRAVTASQPNNQFMLNNETATMVTGGHRRTGSSGVHRRTHSSGSNGGRSLSRERGYISHGSSPYPSPHASPSARAENLPVEGDGFGNYPMGVNLGIGGLDMLGGMGISDHLGGLDVTGLGMSGVGVQVVDVNGQTVHSTNGVDTSIGNTPSNASGATSNTSAASQASINVVRQNVTTHATADASQRRRRTEATFLCPVPGCGSTFTRHFNLKGHLRSHNEERPFKCKWPGCDKGFARQHDCKRHEQLHLNIRPYCCNGCKRNFARMDALNRHLRSDAGTECQARQPILLPDDQPNNPELLQAQVMAGRGGIKTEEGWRATPAGVTV